MSKQFKDDFAVTKTEADVKTIQGSFCTDKIRDEKKKWAEAEAEAEVDVAKSQTEDMTEVPVTIDDTRFCST